MSIRNHHPLIKIVNSFLVDLPTPSNISINWNYGSLLGFILVFQLISGILLATRYSAHGDISFDYLIIATQDISYFWLFRLLHSTGASFFFLFLYLHIGRGIYYGSYVYTEVWNLGSILYLIVIGTAFLGYVLPWGQISFWAATVITNLLTAIPYVGSYMISAIWGNFAVSSPTLVRFFALHYLFPFIIAFLTVLHLFFLHITGSSNPLGISSNTANVSFHYYFSVNDLYYILLTIFILIIFALKFGYVFIDAENFIPANPILTPLHIQPEWYFLFAYAILRSIPNNVGGVVGLFASVLSLFLFSLLSVNCCYSGINWNPISRTLFWGVVFNFLVLTWLGACPAEEPFIEVALWMTVSFFLLIGLCASWSRFYQFFLYNIFI